MTRTFVCIFKFSLMLGLLTQSQIMLGQTNATFSGSLLTQVSKSTSSQDTTQFLICRSNKGDKLTVYTVTQGIVSSGTGYQLSGDGNDFILHIRSIDQQQTDSLHVMFNDVQFTLTINSKDRYLLFPDTYKRLKAMIQKHQLIALLDLINDNLGDYPIKDVLTFTRMRSQVSKQIRMARVTTKRSQSDLTDDWLCTYAYDNSGNLKQLKVSSGKVIRYTKSVKYALRKLVSVNTYLNMEERQITEQKITYFPGSSFSVRWQENVYETGKDRTTQALISVEIRSIGSLPTVEPSFDAVLRILETKTK